MNILEVQLEWGGPSTLLHDHHCTTGSRGWSQVPATEALRVWPKLVLIPLSVCIPFSPHQNPCPESRGAEATGPMGSCDMWTADRGPWLSPRCCPCRCLWVLTSLCSDSAWAASSLCPSQVIPDTRPSAWPPALLWSHRAGQLGPTEILILWVTVIRVLGCIGLLLEEVPTMAIGTSPGLYPGTGSPVSYGRFFSLVMIAPDPICYLLLSLQGKAKCTRRLLMISYWVHPIPDAALWAKSRHSPPLIPSLRNTVVYKGKEVCLLPPRKTAIEGSGWRVGWWLGISGR